MQVDFTCAQLRALQTPSNSRTVARNFAQLRATELRLETLIITLVFSGLSPLKERLVEVFKSRIVGTKSLILSDFPCQEGNDSQRYPYNLNLIKNVVFLGLTLFYSDYSYMFACLYPLSFFLNSPFLFEFFRRQSFSLKLKLNLKLHFKQ